VADPSYDWGAGKERAGKSGKEYFQPAPYQQRLDESIRTKIIELEGDTAAKKAIYDGFTGKKGKKPPKIHVAAFASGAAVLQSKAAVDKLVAHHKDLKAIDMEVHSVMCACHISNLPRPLCIAVKGVCDFGDSKKHDGYQKYAAYASAHALLALIPKILS
jgi:nucleoside phosphorylase